MLTFLLQHLLLLGTILKISWSLIGYHLARLSCIYFLWQPFLILPTSSGIHRYQASSHKQASLGLNTLTYAYLERSNVRCPVILTLPILNIIIAVFQTQMSLASARVTELKNSLQTEVTPRGQKGLTVSML